MTIDYGSTFNGRAIYTPSISAGYATATVKSSANYRGGNIPVPLKDLDFLDPDNPFFFHSHAMMSVGQFWNQNTNMPSTMCSKPRAPGTAVISDSAGFQYAFSNMPFNGNATCRISLKKQEAIADRTHVLDIPLLAINNPHNNFNTYNDCRYTTIQNARYYQSHKTLPGNAIQQGRDWKELLDWCEKVVKPYPFDGISFAGECAHKKPDLIFRLTFRMIREGMFDDWDWIHWLGRATLSRGVMLSMFKRELSKHLCKEITVTYDTSTPFTNAMRQYVVSTFTDFTSGNFGQPATEGLLAKYKLNGAPGPFPFPSEIGKVLSLQDVCVPVKGKASSWDTYGTLLMANHNLDVLLGAIDQAHKLCDLELTIKAQLGRQAYNVARKTSQRLCPKHLVEADYIIKRMFVVPDPDAFLRGPDIYRHLRKC